MAIDVSASMLAKDLKPNRLDALKNVADEFIKNRISDRIGLVEYAGESYTKTPLTTDKSITLRSLRDIKYNNIIEGGTAIGMGLATSVNRIKDSKAKSCLLYTLRAHETVLDLVCRLLLEKKNILQPTYLNFYT